MKRTLDDLVGEFRDFENAKFKAQVKDILESKIRPHVLNLDNWRVDDFSKIVCAPIIIDKPQGMGERYQAYSQAWNQMALELSRNDQTPGYCVSCSQSSWQIDPSISYTNFEVQRRKGRKPTSTNFSAESIYKKTVERSGKDFITIVHTEAARLVEFLSDSKNWDLETKKSKVFLWEDPLKYTKYNAYSEIKRIATLRLQTENHTVTFFESHLNGISASIIGRKQHQAPDQDSESDI